MQARAPEPDPPAQGGDHVRLTATVHGYVQGVGFRWTTMSVAKPLGLVGVAENLPGGEVVVIAEGPRSACESVLAWLRGERAMGVRRPGRVDAVDASFGPARGGFRAFTCR